MLTSFDRVMNIPDVRINMENREGLARGIDSSSQENSDSSINDSGGRTAEDGRRTSSRSVLEAADRLRGEYARLQQTINQNQDAQSLCTFVTAITPFLFLFILKILFDNFLSIFRIVIALGGFIAIDSRVKQLFATVHPSTSVRIYVIIVFVVLFFFTSGLYIYEDGFNMKHALLLQYAGIVYHGFFFTLYVVIITDTFIKMVTSGIKILVSFFGVSMGMKRKIIQFLEYISQMYRCVAPVPQWMHYFIGEDVSGFMLWCNGVLCFLYGIIKIRELWGIARITFECASRMLCPIPYGDYPTCEELDTQGMCSICHGTFTSPTKLSCSHIFCTSCIDTWLECENTCPMCRAIVEKKDNSWKNGETSKGVRFC